MIGGKATALEARLAALKSADSALESVLLNVELSSDLAAVVPFASGPVLAILAVVDLLLAMLAVLDALLATLDTLTVVDSPLDTLSEPGIELGVASEGVGALTMPWEDVGA